MTKRPWLSVILPVYNVQPYLKESIDSVLSQNSDVELLLIDDGSTDGSENIVDQYPGAKVLHLTNGGLSKARNIGIKNATADYIYFMDSDDAIRRGFLESVYRVLESTNADVLSFQYEIIRTDGILDEIKAPISLKSFRTVDRRSCLRMLMDHSISQSAWSYVIRKKILIDNELSFTENILFEDEDSSVRFFAHCNQIVLLEYNMPPYLYRKRTNSITDKSAKNPSVRELTDNILVAKKAYEQYIASYGNRDEVDAWYFNFRVWICRHYGGFSNENTQYSVTIAKLERELKNEFASIARKLTIKQFIRYVEWRFDFVKSIMRPIKSLYKSIKWV